MRIEIRNGQKCFYAILGLPSSGTSIISRFFHAVDNGFCIGEPERTRAHSRYSIITLSMPKLLILVSMSVVKPR